MSEEVVYESWFSRLGGAFKGIVAGIAIFLAGFPLLWWNEGRAVKTAKALTEGAAAVIETTSDSVDPAADGQFVHLTGEATTEEILEDPDFGVSANAIRLIRNAEMYQWQENVESTTRKKLGGGTETVKTYSYKREWSSSPIDSGSFRDAGHENPGSLPVDGFTKTASDVRVGAYQLSDSLIGSISSREALSVGIEDVPQSWQGVIRLNGTTGFYLPANNSPGRGPEASGQVNTQAEPADSGPRIGDVRITYEVTRPSIVSIMSQQAGDTFTPFKTSNGKPLDMLAMGNVPAGDMISRAEAANSMWTWILRGAGFLMMGIGLGMACKPLSVLADVLPIAGDIVGVGTGLISFCIAGACSLGTISLAWLFYRPLLGIPLLIAGVGCIAALAHFVMKSRASKAAMPAAETENDTIELSHIDLGEPANDVAVDDLDEAISV